MPAQQLLGDQEGRIVLSARRPAGFTMIELLIGMTILAIVLGLGAPAMGTYLQNSKLAAATASFYAGVQAARTEAIRRNIQSQFVLTDLPLHGRTSKMTPVGHPERSQLGRSVALPPPAAPDFDARSTRSRRTRARPASSRRASSSIAPFPPVAPARFRSTASAARPTTRPIRSIFRTRRPARARRGGRCVAARSRVSPGGQISACDPAAPAGDSRACT